MRSIDTSAYSSTKASRIKPETIDLGSLPPIEKPSQLPSAEARVVSPPPPFPEESQPQTVETERDSERFSERTEIRTNNRTDKRTDFPIKRQTKRYSFEFYIDQITCLKRIKNRIEENGENIFLSDLVREAIDLYLKERDE